MARSGSARRPRSQEAAASALAAAEAAERPGDRILAGRARTLAGRAHPQPSAPASHRAARAGAGTLQACGARRYADEAARELRKLGGRVAGLPRAARPATGSPR